MLRKTSLEKRGFEWGNTGDNTRWTQRRSSSTLVHLVPGFDHSRTIYLSLSCDDCTISDKLYRLQFLLKRSRRYTMVLLLKWSRISQHYIEWNRRLLPSHRGSTPWTTNCCCLRSLCPPLFLLLRLPYSPIFDISELRFLQWLRRSFEGDPTFF